MDEGNVGSILIGRSVDMGRRFHLLHRATDGSFDLVPAKSALNAFKDGPITKADGTSLQTVRYQLLLLPAAWLVFGIALTCRAANVDC